MEEESFIGAFDDVPEDLAGDYDQLYIFDAEDFGAWYRRVRNAHEREVDGGVDAMPDAQLAEHGLVRLPTDADVVTIELPQSADGKIWTGREVCFWTGPANEDWHKFCGLHYSDGRWCVEDVDFERYPAESVWYERPDGLERIADELEAWCDSVDVDGDACDVPRDLAKRIRKLAAKEDK